MHAIIEIISSVTETETQLIFPAEINNPKSQNPTHCKICGIPTSKNTETDPKINTL